MNQDFYRHPNTPTELVKLRKLMHNEQTLKENTKPKTVKNRTYKSL